MGLAVQSFGAIVRVVRHFLLMELLLIYTRRRVIAETETSPL